MLGTRHCSCWLGLFMLLLFYRILRKEKPKAPKLAIRIWWMLQSSPIFDCCSCCLELLAFLFCWYLVGVASDW